MHIGLILDGNRRWAKKQGLTTAQGHQQGAKHFLTIANYLYSKGVTRISAYILSTENLQRNQQELQVIYELFGQFLRSVASPQKRVEHFGTIPVQIRICGESELFPSQLQQDIQAVTDTNPLHCSHILDFAFCYGGKQEIVGALKRCLAKGLTLTEESILQECCINHCPHLIIRTGGHHRLSNFLLFQSAYSEWFFLDALWPDLSTQQLDQILTEYHIRIKNFGK
jgi:undecaprenyl diphosphate synthase